MRKFYLFLFVLSVLTCGKAQAEKLPCTKVDGSTFGAGYYYIKCKKTPLYELTDPYWIDPGTGNINLKAGSELTDFVGLWYIEETETSGEYYIWSYTRPTYRFGYGPSVPLQTSNSRSNLHYNVTWNTDNSAFLISAASSSGMITNPVYPTSATGFGRAAASESSYVELYKVEFKELPITYTSTTGDTFEKNARFIVGASSSPFCALDYYTINSVTPETITADTERVTANCTPDFPVTPGTVYKMMVRTTDVYMEKDGDVIVTKAANKLSNNNYWFFERVANTQNQFKVRNLGAKTADGSNFQGLTSNVEASSTAVKVAVTFSDEPTAYALVKSGEKFALEEVQNSTYHLGGHDTYNSIDGNKLVSWTNANSLTDAGSQFALTPVTWEMLQSEVPAASESEYLTWATLGTDNLLAATGDVTAEKVYDAVGAIYRGYDVDADLCYMIYSQPTATADKYITAAPVADTEGANASELNLSFSNSDTYLKSVVRFESNGSGQYYIQHVNSGLYFGKMETSRARTVLTADKANAGLYSFEYYSENVLGIQEATNTYNLHYNGEDGTPIGWERTAAADANSRFMLKKTASFPLTLSTAGWSTFCAPVSLTIPNAEELHVYYVSGVANNAVYVRELTGVIPAATPVLIKGTASTEYTFSLTTESGDAVDGNKLMGTTIARTGFATDQSGLPDVYGLKINGESASFVPAYSATIPANKSVLPRDEVGGITGTNAFQLMLDDNGNTTGIAAIPTYSGEHSHGFLRDMSGRIAVYPVRGQVYIKANGQKVIFK